MQRTNDEVGRAAEPRVDPALHPARVRLVEEVDLQRRVHARHPRLTCNEPRVIRDLRAHHAHAAIEVEPVVEFTRAEDKGCGQRHLVIKGPFFMQIEHTIAEHLRPDAQPLDVGQRSQDGVGDRSNPELQGGVRLDERRDPVANHSLDITKIASLVGGKRLIYLDDVVDFVLINLRVAVGVRHLLVGLDDNETAMCPRRLDGRRQDIDLSAEAHSVEPAGGSMQEHDIRPQLIAKEHRH